jgi:hypothetical protein
MVVMHIACTWGREETSLKINKAFCFRTEAENNFSVTHVTIDSVIALGKDVIRVVYMEIYEIVATARSVPI